MLRVMSHGAVDYQKISSIMSVPANEGSHGYIVSMRMFIHTAHTITRHACVRVQEEERRRAEEETEAERMVGWAMMIGP